MTPFIKQEYREGLPFVQPLNVTLILLIVIS